MGGAGDRAPQCLGRAALAESCRVAGRRAARVWLPVIGELGVDWLVVALNGAIALLLLRWRSGASMLVPAALRVPIGLVAALGIATVLLSSVGWVAPRQSLLQVGLVQNAVPSVHEFTAEQREELLGEYQSLVARVHSGADLVVLPEAAIPHRCRRMA